MPRRQPRIRRLRTAARWPAGVALTAYRYLWRTTPVHRWEMTGSPALDAPPAIPDGTDLDGLQGVADGTGPLVHRIYRTRIIGSAMDPGELMELIREDLDRIAPSAFAAFQRLDCDGPLKLGDDYIVRMPGPWDGPVRVVVVEADAFRLATLTDHLEAGQIEFRVGADHRGLEFTIESWARSGDHLSDLLYTHLRLSKEVQLHMWTSVLERVVRLADGRMSGGIVITTRVIQGERPDDGSTDFGSRREMKRLDELSKRRVNFDTARIAEYEKSAGWHVDDMVESLPHEAPGPPASGDVWDVAQRLVIDYQLADPGVVRAVYRQDAPLEGRDMLLRIRFLGFPIYVGVRIGEVYEGERQVRGRRAHVFGWVYRTLEGHFEEGEMHYQLWKWLDSGDIEFRVHAVSRPADTGPWALRTGFRLVGRRNQLRFYRQICRRLRRLTESELEASRGH